jgi:sulfur carrier protein
LTPRGLADIGGGTLKLTVNGEAHEVADGLTLAELIALLSLKTEHVAVEVNAAVVRRAAHPTHRLTAGDAIEIVTFVGGG